MKTRRIAITAILAALITVTTAYVCHIPLPYAGGYLHFGDSLIYLAACLLPRPYACAAAAIGGGMADLLTAPMWAPATILIKMLITLPFTNKGAKIVTLRNALAPLAAYVISGTGYFLFETLFFHADVAFLVSFAGSAIQSLGSGAIFILFGMLLDNAGFKKQLEF